jgi:hypothetical protein
VDESTAHLTPTVGVLATDNDDIRRHAQISEGAMEAHRLLGLVRNLRLDNEKVDIAVGTALSASVGAEQNHLGFRSSRSQAASRLVDQALVNNPHIQIVVATADRLSILPVEDSVNPLGLSLALRVHDPHGTIPLWVR